MPHPQTPAQTPAQNPAQNPGLVERFADRWMRRYRATSSMVMPATQPAVLITGASEGIGLALAHQFACNPRRRVILVSRRADVLVTAAAAIHKRSGVTPLILPLDVTKPDAAAEIDRFLGAHILHLDVLVNNAGVGLSGRFSDASLVGVEQLLALNIAALTRLMRHFLPGMLARGTGGVINIASLGGLTPGPFQATYYASKAYVISLTRAVQAECAGQGVRIAVVAPGPVETQFHQRMAAESAYYRRCFRAPNAEFVARVAYRGFRWGRTTIIPGWSWSMLAMIMSLVPLTISVPVVRWLLRPRH